LALSSPTQIVTIDFPGECRLLGDNGGNQFIKTMSGVLKPTSGEIKFEN
jgi:ABC-type sugar transport system ATPase subunit